jgi:hypothetical protein
MTCKTRYAQVAKRQSLRVLMALICFYLYIDSTNKIDTHLIAPTVSGHKAAFEVTRFALWEIRHE